MNQQTIRAVQKKILDIMLFIDRICREHGIIYYIMGGTALGAVRHRGFIPWDDDLDIFMTPENYGKFKIVFSKLIGRDFVLQEWKICEDYLEYAKVRANGTTFIEECFRDRKDMHHGIYVDIMILHKCPNNQFLQNLLYYQSRYVTVLALSQRNWQPKNVLQKAVLCLLNILPNDLIASYCYKSIYKYDELTSGFSYCYFITKAKFHQGIFGEDVFKEPIEIMFENVLLMAPTKIKTYLALRYGDYMRLPSVEQQQAAVHATTWDINKSYTEYFQHQ